MAFYHLYEWSHAAVAPWRAAADVAKLAFQHPFNPLSSTTYGRSVVASAELFERTTRRYGKPDFGLDETVMDGRTVPVQDREVWSSPFCRLLHFDRAVPEGRKPDPKLLIVAPMSGHYATLLRGTVEAMLPSHEVYITDWVDARDVPVADGRFDLDDYVDHVIAMLHHLGPNTHVMAVCQPSVPVLTAVALMEEDGDPHAPASMTLMGGPIDTRINPTAVNKLAEEKGVDWFARNVVMTVPFPNAGVGRKVYPGFLQLTGFMSMNLDRHMTAHRDLFRHLVDGDGDSADKHREFYDEYLAVMDLTAEFYLQTVDTVFVNHALPRGRMTHRARAVRPQAIRNTALLTVEGERDDISGVGQTEAAHGLCSGLAPEKKAHHLQPKVGHYGVFNGSRFRADIAPRIARFMREHDQGQARRSPVVIAGRPAGGSEDEAIGAANKAGGGEINVSQGDVAVADDLTRIKGIGPKIAEDLADAGVTRYAQIATMTSDMLELVDHRLALHGRSARDRWVEQARKLTRSALA